MTAASRVSLPVAMTPRVFVVQSVRRETADVVTLALQATDGGIGPRPSAGQFNMLYAWGVGEAPISVSGLSGDGREVLHTIRAVGAVTRALCELEPGDELGLRGPFGSSWPLDALVGRDVVVVAGGVGFAPLRAAMRAIVERRAVFGDVRFLYGARQPADVLFKEELAAWEARGVAVSVTVDHVPPEARSWRGSVGNVGAILPRSLAASAHTAALLCGPEVMMRHVALDLLRLGVPADAIHVSMERSMKCAVGICGHCQYQPWFVCRDGPVFAWPQVERLVTVKEV